MVKTTSPSLETGMLAFSRSIQISEGLFFAHNADGTRRTPVAVTEKGVRGQSSEDAAKNPGLSNPQTVECAMVPSGYAEVELSFSVRVLQSSRKPHACDSITVSETYAELATAYAGAGGYKFLAELYVWNIANGRFAWRNRFQSDSQRVQVCFDGRKLAFDPLMLSLKKPAGVEDLSDALILGDRSDLEALIEGIGAALAEGSFVFDVSWIAAMREGQEIFPSQEYLREENKAKLKDVSRILAKLPVFVGDYRIQQASMHSQKIGAALRAIDIWHGDEDYGVVPVNPYAGDQETGKALRGAKNSFYALRKMPEALIAGARDATSPDDISDEVHFVMANLVRGGVFGAKNTKKEKAA